MAFVFNRHSRKPYPLQFNEQLLAQVVAGRLANGARLPSVRALARGLHISRTTAHRIHASLHVGGVAEVRPRSGAFVVRHGSDRAHSSQHAQETCEFLKDVLDRAQALGLDPMRLGKLLQRMAQDDAQIEATTRRPVFAMISTQDWFECVSVCLGDAFPAHIVRLPPQRTKTQVQAGVRYLLFGYFMNEEARRLAEATGCHPLLVRYNVALFNRAMAIPAGEHRYLVTRDQDNADATRTFLTKAYPEVDVQRYDVWTVRQWLDCADARNGTDQTWATVTAAPFVRHHIDRARLRLLGPLLAPDFVDELRHLALIA